MKFSHLGTYVTILTVFVCYCATSFSMDDDSYSSGYGDSVVQDMATPIPDSYEPIPSSDGMVPDEYDNGVIVE